LELTESEYQPLKTELIAGLDSIIEKAYNFELTLYNISVESLQNYLMSFEAWIEKCPDLLHFLTSSAQSDLDNEDLDECFAPCL